MQLVVPGPAERWQCQPAVEDDPEVTRALDDWDGNRQDRDVVDVNMLQLLAGAEPHHLRLGRVHTQSTGSHPVVDFVDADCEVVGGYPYIADWQSNVNLAVVGILVDVQTMTENQLFKLSSVQKVQQRPQNATLQNSKQKLLLPG